MLAACFLDVFKTRLIQKEWYSAAWCSPRSTEQGGSTWWIVFIITVSNRDHVERRTFLLVWFLDVGTVFTVYTR